MTERSRLLLESLRVMKERDGITGIVANQRWTEYVAEARRRLANRG